MGSRESTGAWSLKATLRKVTALLVYTILPACTVLPTTRAFAVDVGEAAPEFALQALDGKEISLASLKGKVVYLDFWASWCGPCKHTLPWMNKLAEQFKDSNVQIVAVSVDQKRENVDKALASVQPHYTILHDPTGTTAAAYKLGKMPTSFLIGPDGVVKNTFSGFRSETESEVVTAIKQFSAPNAETHP